MYCPKMLEHILFIHQPLCRKTFSSPCSPAYTAAIVSSHKLFFLLLTLCFIIWFLTRTCHLWSTKWTSRRLLPTKFGGSEEMEWENKLHIHRMTELGGEVERWKNKFPLRTEMTNPCSVHDIQYTQLALVNRTGNEADTRTFRLKWYYILRSINYLNSTLTLN